jgi:hypothetical protein
MVTGIEDIPSKPLKCVGELQICHQQLIVYGGRQNRRHQTGATAKSVPSVRKIKQNVKIIAVSPYYAHHTKYLQIGCDADFQVTTADLQVVFRKERAKIDQIQSGRP